MNRVKADDLNIGDIYIDLSHNLQKVLDRPLPEKDLGITRKQLTKTFMPNKQDMKGTKWELEKIRPATKDDFDKYPLIENTSSVDWEEENFDLIWDEYARRKAKELGISEDEVPEFDTEGFDEELYNEVAWDLYNSDAGLPDPDMYAEAKELSEDNSISEQSIWDKVDKIVSNADSEMQTGDAREYNYDNHIMFAIYRDVEYEDIFQLYTYVDGELQEEFDTGDIHLEDMDKTMVDIINKIIGGIK